MINLKEEHARENKQRGEEMLKKLMNKQGGLPETRNKENQGIGQTPSKANNLDRINALLNKK